MHHEYIPVVDTTKVTQDASEGLFQLVFIGYISRIIPPCYGEARLEGAEVRLGLVSQVKERNPTSKFSSSFRDSIPDATSTA